MGNFLGNLARRLDLQLIIHIIDASSALHASGWRMFIEPETSGMIIPTGSGLAIDTSSGRSAS